MRLCEQSLLKAELLRLQNRFGEAVKAFHETRKMCQDAKLFNLVSVAEHRCRLAQIEKEKSDFLDNLLEDITAS